MEPNLRLTPDLQKKCRFDGSAPVVTLDDFLPHLDEIAGQVVDRIVKEKVQEAARFYCDPAEAKRQMCQRLDNTRDEIVLIYRLRNSIVHHGHFDRKLLAPFAARARELAGNVVGLLFTKFIHDLDCSVEKIFTDAKVQYDRTIDRLDSNLPVDFYSFKQWGTYPRIASEQRESG